MPYVCLSYYGVGLPLGCSLGFAAGWGATGMVVGMLGGKLVHATAFVALVLQLVGRAVCLDDSAPCARLVPPRAQAAPTRPRAQPERRGSYAVVSASHLWPSES